MSTTFTPNVDAVNYTESLDMNVMASRPVSSFLQPKITSWITGDYYQVPLNVRPVQAAATLPLAESAPVVEVSETVQVEVPTYEMPAQPSVEGFAESPAMSLPVVAKYAAPYADDEDCSPAPVIEAPTRKYLPTEPEVAVLDGLDVNRLAPELQQVANESHISHVQTVIRYLQKGGEGLKTFGKIFLNDVALQKAVVTGLMDESSAALQQLDALHRELALRLAACVQARQVAQLILADV